MAVVMFLFEMMFWKSDGSQTGSVCLSTVCTQTSDAMLWPFICLWKFPRINLLTTPGLSICVTAAICNMNSDRVLDIPGEMAGF